MEMDFSIWLMQNVEQALRNITAAGKRIQFHPEVFSALEELSDDRMATLQELADEAFDDSAKHYSG